MTICFFCRTKFESGILICSKCGKRFCSEKCIKNHQRKGCINYNQTK